jgi:hypothetical protein
MRIAELKAIPVTTRYVLGNENRAVLILRIPGSLAALAGASRGRQSKGRTRTLSHHRRRAEPSSHPSKSIGKM